MKFDVQVKVRVFDWIVQTTNVPSVAEIAEDLGAPEDEVAAAFRALAGRHLLVLGDDGEITMPSPFSVKPTDFRVETGGRTYYANCIWDALAVLAALHQPGTVHASCGDCGDPMSLEVTDEGPVDQSWVAHFAVPAAHWRDDVFYT